MVDGIEAVFDLEQIDRAIANLDALGRDARWLMKEIGVEMVRGARRRLGGSTAPDGTSWPGLNPAYAALRAELHPGTEGMLKVRGTLSRSLTFDAGPNSVRVGSPLIYAGVHQAGAVIQAKGGKGLAVPLMGANGHVFLHHFQRVTIPARPYLGIGEPERQGIEKAYLRAMQRAFAV